MDETNILALNPKFHQIVSQNTRKNKILTILITDLPGYYQVPQIIPPVPVDVFGHGVPSDHNGVFVLPITSENSQRKSIARKVQVRPLPESLICKFGSVLVKEDWAFLTPLMTSTKLVGSFENYTRNIIEKKVTISDRDKPYMTEELKLLRCYIKGGRSEKYLSLLKKFELKMKIEAEKYHKKILSEVAEGKRNNTYSALRKLEFGHDHTTQTNKSNFTLPSHAEENLSPVRNIT